MLVPRLDFLIPIQWMSDAFDVKKYQSDDWADAQADACLDENGDEIGKSIMDEFTKLN